MSADDLGWGMLKSCLTYAVIIAVFAIICCSLGYCAGHRNGYKQGQQDLRNEYFYNNLPKK